MDNFTAAFACGADPRIIECNGRFDFTLSFEQYLLSVAPSTALLLAIPIRLYQLLHEDHKVSPHLLHKAKIATCTLFGALQFTLLILWAEAPAANRISLIAAVLGILDAVALGVLSHTEHMRSIRPSTVICVYLLFSILFDTVQCRTLWLLGLNNLATSFSVALSLKFAMFMLEVQGKRRILLPSVQATLSPESTSGIIGRGFFWWLNDLLFKGFVATLSLSGLYELDDELRSNRLLQKLQHRWDKNKQSRKHALVRSVFSSTKGTLLVTVFPRLVLIGFKFSQPFLINRIITYIEGDKGPDTKAEALGLIAATSLVYFGNALSTGFYQHKLFRFVTMVRGSLVSLIIAKNLDTNAPTSASPVALISTDVRNICKSFESLHEVWANPIEIGIAIWLLQRHLGLGSVGPAITILICAYGTGKLAQCMPPSMKTWLEHIQTRIDTTSEVIMHMKETKMLGMTAFLKQRIQSLRTTELAQAKKYRALITYMSVLSFAPSLLAPVATFGIAIAAQRISSVATLSIATVFTSLAIIDLLCKPLSQLITSLPQLVASLGSFERIEAFVARNQTTVRDTASTSAQNNTPRSSIGGSTLELTRRIMPNQREVASIKNGSLYANPQSRPILHNINLSILPSSLTIIIGRVGSGKTTLIKGLLGELHATGSISLVQGGAAYCAQTAWLVALSIRQNILGQETMDQEWYDRVIYACALGQDFAQLQSGDQTLVGNKGQSLSGGQQQRIALARAIYSKKRVIFIDDALSGLDSSTQRHVWHHVFGVEGLTRQYGITTVMVTHTLEFLSYADNIVILGDEGNIAKQGSYDEIRGSAFLESLSIEQKQGDSTARNDEPAEPKPGGSVPIQSSANENRQQDFLRKTGDLKVYWYYLKSIGWWYGFWACIFLLCDCLLRVFPQIWLRYWTENDEMTGGENTSMYFGVYAGMSLLGLLVVGINSWIVFVLVVPKSSGSLHWKLLQSVMKAPLSFFLEKDPGDLINRFSQDLSHIDRDLPIAMFMTSLMALDCLSGTVLILVGAKYLASVIPIALLTLYWLQAFYLRTSRQMRLLDLQAQAPLLSKLIETTDGLPTIRSFGWQGVFYDKSLHLLDESQKPYYLLLCIQRWLTLALDLFVGGLAVVLVAMAMFIPDSTSPGAIAVALYNVLSFNQNLASLITNWTELETALGAIYRLRAFEIQTPAEPSPVDEVQLPPQWPSEGHVEIEKMTVTYDSSIKPALQGISLSLNPGDKLAICGRTGSGKSSLTLALFQLLSLESGYIAIDGVDISRVDRNNLRRRLIAIPQEPVLFPGTLRMNLFPWIDKPDEIPTDQDLICAMTKVLLWPAISLRGGLDTDISNFSLSKGQKQLLCLARAVVRKHSSKVLILDEATSAVDQETEAIMTEIIKEEFTAHTVISVIHRQRALRGMHKVATLQDGKVFEIRPVEA